MILVHEGAIRDGESPRLQMLLIAVNAVKMYECTYDVQSTFNPSIRYLIYAKVPRGYMSGSKCRANQVLAYGGEPATLINYFSEIESSRLIDVRTVRRCLLSNCFRILLHISSSHHLSISASQHLSDTDHHPDSDEPSRAYETLTAPFLINW